MVQHSQEPPKHDGYRQELCQLLIEDESAPRIFVCAADAPAQANVQGEQRSPQEWGTSMATQLILPRQVERRTGLPVTHLVAQSLEALRFEPELNEASSVGQKED